MGHKVKIYGWQCLAPEHEERCTSGEPYHLSSPRAKRRTNLYFCYAIPTATRCDSEGCDKEIAADTKHLQDWNQVKAAANEGWFFRQDGTLDLCFDHLTVGLIAWRDRNNPGWRGRLRKGLAEKLPTVESARRVAPASRVGYTGSSRTRPTRPEGNDPNVTADPDS
jgi:hypothetical protein